MAYALLTGVGDRGQEWTEWTGYAYHLRRRLRPGEEAGIGPAVDCRGTAEGLRRFEAAKGVLPDRAILLAKEELYG
jgi:hypothetical protein